MIFQINDVRNALIVGAGHGIGLAMTKYLLEKCPKINLIVTYRNPTTAKELIELQDDFKSRLNIYKCDPTLEQSVSELSNKTSFKNRNLDLIVNCVGLLHSENISPEKSLRSFCPDQFMEILRVNTLVTPLLAKYFEKYLKKETVTSFITLSAKVGSIGDNKMGGWYSYRASKAALNMLIKNISIEFSRKRKNCIVLAIHPGTTDTFLSRPFYEKTNLKIHQPIDTAQNIIDLLCQRVISDTGKFYSWNGEEIEW